jgi:small redox-active disulfide protein 2
VKKNNLMGGKNMKIEILGMGCQKCNMLYSAAKQAVEELGIAAEFVKVEDLKEIMKYGNEHTGASGRWCRQSSRKSA